MKKRKIKAGELPKIISAIRPALPGDGEVTRVPLRPREEGGGVVSAAKINLLDSLGASMRWLKG